MSITLNMHALHTFAHRAPPATRTRVRWQPYSSVPTLSSSSSSSSVRSSPASYLNTPAASVSSSPQIAAKGASREPITNIPVQIPKDIPIAKDISRNKYITGLVGQFSAPHMPLLSDPDKSFQDQAVKSLSEIWRPQDIPSVFQSSAHQITLTCEPSLVADPKPSPPKQYRNTQLPSPISPSTHSSPALSSASSPPSTSASSTFGSDAACTPSSRVNLVPIKSFVHEVLRRSRTSGCVLQTALCYLEAIRGKVPELVRAEQAGEGVQGEVDQSDWITPATPEELQRERELNNTGSCDSDIDIVISDESLVATVRIDDHSKNTSFSQSLELSIDEGPPSHLRLPPAPKLPPLPPLPSPLLCPRRAFLASLILASKFTQDKCYSNRAWAKLSGLPPREIGRCERALGEALEWRLWVGKQPLTSSLPSPPISAHRPLTRVQSESCLNLSTPGPFLVREDKVNANAMHAASGHRGLRRHATLPSDLFASTSSSSSIQVSLDQVPWRIEGGLPSSWPLTNVGDAKMVGTSQSRLKDLPRPTTGNDLLFPSSGSIQQSIHNGNQSPSPGTPSLSYSPSSTESCSGDRTIQMSSFLDDAMAAPNLGNTSGSEFWPWLETSETFNPAQPSLPTWDTQKITPNVDGSFLGVAPIDYTGRAPAKMAEIDGGHPWVSALPKQGHPVSAYPCYW
ncbi:hypothetical protein H0H93_009128 [Arthromyces matolae]|nr:hypothetical protein H0H93_009128 [Arthromyces matolae]